MEPSKPSTALFDVFLRLRPSYVAGADRFMDVERCEAPDEFPKHITVQPPTDNRKRAVEKFAFTRVFEENASQLEILEGTGAVPLIEGVLGSKGKDGRDGLLATLGVTGSGKSHTILGSKSQRGLTQMTLDTLYRSIAENTVHPTCIASVFPSLSAADVSEAHLVPASVLLDTLYGDVQSTRGSCSRAQTPMPVNKSSFITPTFGSNGLSGKLYPILKGMGSSLSPKKILTPPLDLPGSFPFSRESTPNMPSLPQVQDQQSHMPMPTPPSPLKPKSTLPGHFARLTQSKAAKQILITQDTSFISFANQTTTSKAHRVPRPSAMPTAPSIDHINLACDSTAEYAVILSMYEVYNDRIYDLLAGATSRTGSSKLTAQKTIRRPLLFKSTEMSPDRKVVAGLRKIVCATFEEALSVLEIGLTERKVAGTGSNAVSSRSHGFFCIEVKKRPRVGGFASGGERGWSSAALTIVDLAGSERARTAKTQGQTLAEAGKINESLMYLGQCMQMQGDHQDGKQHIVPFRQCKLTELLFSNSFPSAPSAAATHLHPPGSGHRNAQKGIMIVTADPVGDFNATSQILRYSALAREVTVPRIPSVTSTLAPPTTTTVPATPAASRPGTSLSQHSSHSADQTASDLETALATISALKTSMDVLHLRLEEEKSHTAALEHFITTSDLRWAEREQELRDECFEEMDRLLAVERGRWKQAWLDEEERLEGFVDRKIEIVTRDVVVDVFEDPAAAGEHDDDDDDMRVTELEDEVSMLRKRVRELERSASGAVDLGASPTKRARQLAPAPAQEQFRELQDENRHLKMELEEVKRAPPVVMVGPAKSPLKKLKPLKARKWDVDVGGEED